MNERCEFCKYSIYRDEDSLFCMVNISEWLVMRVQKIDICKKFSRGRNNFYKSVKSLLE